MDWDKFQAEVLDWSMRNFGNQATTNPLVGMVEEVGELAHAVLKLNQGIRGTREEHIANAADAIADAIIYMADYTGRRNTPIEEQINVWTMNNNLNDIIIHLASEIYLISAHAKPPTGRFIAMLKNVAELLDIDFERTVQETWDKVKQRDWKKNPEKGV